MHLWATEITCYVCDLLKHRAVKLIVIGKKERDIVLLYFVRCCYYWEQHEVPKTWGNQHMRYPKHHNQAAKVKEVIRMVGFLWSPGKVVFFVLLFLVVLLVCSSCDTVGTCCAGRIAFSLMVSPSRSKRLTCIAGKTLSVSHSSDVIWTFCSAGKMMFFRAALP